MHWGMNNENGCFLFSSCFYTVVSLLLIIGFVSCCFMTFGVNFLLKLTFILKSDLSNVTIIVYCVGVSAALPLLYRFGFYMISIVLFTKENNH